MKYIDEADQKYQKCSGCGVMQPLRELEDGKCKDRGWCSTHGTNAPKSSAPEPAGYGIPYGVKHEVPTFDISKVDPPLPERYKVKKSTSKNEQAHQLKNGVKIHKVSDKDL